MDAEAFVGFRQVPAARYGGLMATTAALPRRIHAFVRWVVRTPWPLFSLSMLQSDIIGALFVLGFLRYGLPPQDNIQLQDLPPVNLLIFVSTVIILFLAGAVVNLKLLMPVFRWQRRDNLLTEPDPAATELARSRALRMPLYRTLISLAVWATGGGVFILASWSVAKHAAPVVAVATALGATATASIGYLQSERVLRPVAVAALRSGVPENVNAPGVILRLMLAWIPSTGVPLLAIVLAVAADKIALLHATPEALFNPILMMALAALGIGSVSTLLVAMSIADPLRQLRWALSEVQRGNYNAHMQIYDASELGLLQAGFNDMVRELSERQRLRDLFGRYVGEDVARRALSWAVRNATSRCCSWIWSAPRNWPRHDRPPRWSSCSTSSSGWWSKPSPGTVGSSTSSKATPRWPSSVHPSNTPTVLVPRYRQHVSSTTNSSQCWVPRSSASACRPEGPSPATSALKPASSTPSSATRSTRPPGSPNWPNSRMATFWRRRSRSVAPWTPKHCVGMLARWLSSADVLHPPN